MLGSSRGSGRWMQGSGQQEEPQHWEAGRAPLPSPNRASGSCYSSVESLTEGQPHAVQRGSSISAWHHSIPGKVHAADAGERPSGSGSEGGWRCRDSDNVPLRGSVTINVHADGAAQSSGSEDEESAHAATDADTDADAAGSARSASAAAAELPVSQPELQEMINWETNNLFDYLRGLYRRGEAQQGQELDSEGWEPHIAALRRLLRERDGEAEQLRGLLEGRQRQVEGQRAELLRATARVEVLEQRIRQLLRQLEAEHAASGGQGVAIHGGGGKAAAAHSPKRQLAAAYQPPPGLPATGDACLVHLPPRSYAAHSGCGFWQSATEAAGRHPRRAAAAVAACLLFLLILLCATIIPATKRAHASPSFLAPPAVTASGASWLDLAVRLDRQAVVSFMAFRQADMNAVVGGTGSTLLQLLQGEGVPAAAVVAASAPAASLAAGAAPPLAGLLLLAAACGWGPAADASGHSVLSVVSVTAAASATCSVADDASRCALCPQLDDATPYTLLVVASSPSGRGLSRVQVLSAATGAAALNVNAVEPPFADNATTSAFDLHFKLNSPDTAGTLYWAVAYDRLFASYGPYQLAFGAATPPSTAVVGANPTAFLGGLVANGSVAVDAGGLWLTVRVAPPCVAGLCKRSLHGLQAGTAYRVFLVSVDGRGMADPVPAVTTVTTAAAVAGPALLPSTAPVNITDSGFGARVGLDAAGGIYFALLAPKPQASEAFTIEVPAGSWIHLDSLLPISNSSRRLLLAPGRAGTGHSRRLQAAGTGQVAPGSLVAPVCYPANQTCSVAPSAAFNGVDGLAGSFDTLAAGCLPVPEAGAPLALPAFGGLSNNTLYFLLLSPEDSAVPQPNHQLVPAVFAVRTVDLSAPRLACGFPLAANITSSSFSLAAMLTKPGATVRYVVLPAAAAATAPTAQEVLRGTGAGGTGAAAAGILSQWGSLPWEAAPAAGAELDPRKLWAPVAGLQGGTNYTAFLALTEDGSTPAASSEAAALSGILTPATVPPTFTRLRGLNTNVDEQRGAFSVQLAAELDRAGQVFYALYRNYTCIQGEPSVADIVAGNRLPRSVCACDDPSYCELVAAGSFPVPAETLGAIHSIGGNLSPLPFQALRSASDDLLKCFQGGLGQATDTYNVYLVAGSALPTFTGLAPQCDSFALAAVTTAAAPASDADADAGAGCAATPQLACAQVRLRPDSQALQSGAIQPWTLNASGAEPLAWLPPAAGAAARRPARVQLSLEGGSAPAFTWGPAFPPALQTASSFGMQFALDKPALLIYAVFRPMPIDASGAPQAPVLVATGRVPVFDARANASTGTIQACPWAPGGAMQPASQYYITYVARDKYGRMDGLCPGQRQGAAPRVCTDLAFTGG